MTMKLMAGLAQFAQIHPPSSSDTIANSEVAMDDTAAVSDATFTGDAAGSENSHSRFRFCCILQYIAYGLLLF